MSKKISFLILLFLLFLGGVVFWQNCQLLRLKEELKVVKEREESFLIGAGCLGDIPSEKAEEIIASQAERAILALKDQDFVKLADLINPDKGLRFSPYTNIDEAGGQIFTGEEIRNITVDTNSYLWGIRDASGFPIELTFIDYFDEFVYSQDFANAPVISFNHEVGQGNMVNNISQVYPKAIIVEYHFPGFDPQYGGLDWESLRLVFTFKCGKWYLTALVHAGWTI
jgi:hypothetical protein